MMLLKWILKLSTIIEHLSRQIEPNFALDFEISSFYVHYNIKKF